MKKLRKTKKDKNQTIKGKWSVGKTIASVVSAITLVSGATVLGVYVAGGFEEKIVRPESIAFEYDADLFDNGQLEISGVDEFSLTITTQTEDVTKDKVKLYFGTDVAYKETTQYISNGVIKVPKEVTLSQPFKVELLDISTSDNDKTLENIILNGTTLYAEGDNNMIEPISIKIAVDSPVQRIENYITDLNGNRLNAVGAGQEFKVATTFYPAVSRYMYGDTSREKVVLYSVASGNEYIEEQTYDDNFGVTFKAGNEIVDGISINAYTFKSAKAQEEALGYLSDEDSNETRYDNLYTQLTGGEHVSNTGITITMASASISSFDIAKDGGTITVKEGETGTIKVNGSDGVSLGARIESTDSQVLTYMLENVALEFVHSNGTPFSESEIGEEQALDIKGRKIGIDGHILFLPYNTPDDKNNCYWDITSSLSQNVRVNVYLVITEAEGKTLFKVGDSVVVKSFTLKTEGVVNEEPKFVGQDDVSLNVPQETITLNVENNTIQEQDLNLKNYIVNKNQIVQFYVKAVDGNISEIIRGPFNGEVGGWTKLMENTITIIGAGSFEVKFETVKEDGSVIQTCEATKTFVCQQALSEGSIDESKTTISVIQAGEAVTTGEAYLAPVENDKFEVTFTVASTSSTAFADEFKNGKISISVLGKKDGGSEEDITEYFSIISSPETPTETLTYTLSLKSSPNEDREITKIILTYKKDSNSINDIDWAVLLPLTTQNDEGDAVTGAKIFIYSPKTENITISNAPTSVNYKQTLTAGGLSAEIKVGEDTLTNVQGLISSITGNGENIVLTDQKGRTDTLSGKWKFAVQEGGGILNLEKQTFNVKSTGTVKLKIQADDSEKFALMNEEEYVLTINSVAQGIDHLTYQDSKKVKEVSVKSSEAISSVKVEKYGVKDWTFTLTDLVKYYLDKDEKTQYSNISYKFSDAFFETLTDKQILDLFGENGMLSINGQDYGTTAGEIKNNLAGEEITSIKINDNFGKKCDLIFEITDTNKTFSTMFTFSLLSNIDIAEVTYEDVYCEYGFELKNTITYNDNPENKEWISTLAGVYDEGTWYVLKNANGYYVSDSKEGTDTVYAEITDGKITFKDFFDAESKTFQILFNDQNSYKFNFSNKFTVARNIEVVSNNKTFYIYPNSDDANANKAISYIKVQRIKGEVALPEISYASTNGYLNVQEVQEGQDNNKIFAFVNGSTFAYNKQFLVEEIKVSCGGAVINNVDINIEFSSSLSSTTLYNKIADIISSGNYKGNVQVIDDITYIVLDSSATMWTFEGKTLDGKTIEIDSSVNSYTKSGNYSFRLKEQTQTLAGYNDQKYYLAFKVGNNGEVKIIVPLIISKVGSSPIKYGDSTNQDLANALMSAEQLAEKYKTKSFVAGSEYNLDEFVKFVSGQKVEFDEVGAKALEDKGYRVNRDILKEIENSKACPKISLNNLDDGYVYLPLTWTVNDTVFHYLIVVKSNIEIKGPVYAYNGDGEYLTCEEDDTCTVDFGATYDETTLNNGEKRFSVESGGEQIDATINYYIKSVSIGGNNYTSEGQWSRFVSFDLTEANKVKITPKTQSPITIVVGISSVIYNDNTTVFDEKTYTIIINENKVNYVVDIPDLTSTDNTYTWTISNIGGGTHDLVIKLRDVTGGSIGTEKHDILNVTSTLGEDEENPIASYEYNSSNKEKKDSFDETQKNVPATTLRLTLNDYIPKDETITFILYTKYGYLATLNVNLTANASVAGKTTELQGGENYNFADLFDVTLNNAENTTYTIDSVSFKEDNEVDNKFITYANGEITVANLFEDKDVTMTAIINFGKDESGKDRTFTFSQDFTLKANVAIKAELPDGNVIAGKGLTLDAVDFLDKNITTATITCDTSEKWAVSENGGTSITITPKFVSAQTTYTLTLTIKIPFGEGVYAEKTVAYTIIVHPAVTLSPNYPKPNGKKLEKEYIKSKDTFTSMLTFLNDKAEYADGNRVVFKANELDGTLSDETIGSDNLSIQITECQNVKLTVDGTELKNGENISSLDKKVTFERGTSGSASLITFAITYKGVTISYSVEVLEEVFTFDINYQTNNIETGEYTDKNGETAVTTAVTYEILYMDKTNISDLFANGRMAKIKLNPAVTEGDYKFVFTKDGTYYVSQNVTILSADAGKLMTYDLGYSMAGKTLQGVYLASDLADSEKFTIEVQDKNLVLTKGSDQLEKLERKSDLFSSSIELVNRVELRYGGNVVAYSKYDKGITTDSLSLTANDLDQIKSFVAINNGDKYLFTYYFKATIDIAVDKQASGVQNYQIVNVNEETESIVEFFGIRHATTGNLVTKSEFNRNVNLSYEICGESAKEDFGKATNNAYSELTFVDNSKVQYFKIEVGKRNSQEGVYDFEFLPLGAQNEGNFILTKLTYSANGISKSFYIVLKIMPDYLITFNNVESGVEEDENNKIILSNSQSIISVADLGSATDSDGNVYSVYKDFTLLKTGVGANEDGILSIKHKNGLNTDNELASNFTVTLPLDENDYNNSTNVGNKLMNSTNLSNWEKDGDTYTLKTGSEITTSFTKVPEVVFGDQKYYIKVEDSFGFKIRLYFSLKLVSGSSPTQYSSSAITIAEGAKVDITARYEQLAITAGTKGTDNITPLTIHSTSIDPESSELTLIELSGIKAYGFALEYNDYLTKNTNGGYSVGEKEISKTITINSSTKEQTQEYSLSKIFEKTISKGEIYNLKVDSDEVTFKYSDKTVTLKDKSADITIKEDDTDKLEVTVSANKSVTFTVSFTTTYSLDSDYLKVPTIQYVTVNKVIIKDENGNELKTISSFTGATTIATSNNLIFNGYSPRNPAQMFTMPTLDSNIFGTNATARVTMYIELRYKNSDNIEICTVPVNIEVTRGLTLQDGDTNVAVDDVAFPVANIFKVPSKTQNTAGAKTASTESDTTTSTTLSYINDTLEVKVNQNSNVKFNLTKGSITKEYSISNVGYSYDKTYYLSISEIMGENVKETDTITISVDSETSGNATFAYLKNGENDITNLSFKISKITQDKISVDDVSLLSRNNYYKQAKYYLVAKASEGKYYRFVKNYYVTGKYYKMVNTSTQEIDNYLNVNATTAFSTWGMGLNFYGLEADENGLSLTGGTNGNTANLYFEIDKTDSLPEDVTLDSNGAITTKEAFTTDNYVKINIYQKVSGDSEYYHYLGSIRLSLNTALNYSYNEVAHTASLTSIRECDSDKVTGNREITIPESVTYGGEAYTVTSIEKEVFKGMTSLEAVTIPSKVTFIGENAFEYCEDLTTVTIDSNTISNGLTSSDACGKLIEHATTIYIKNGCTAGSYITSNFTQTTSDQSGYVKWVKKS